MGRMHSKGKGMSGSALPYKRTPPSWLKITANEVRHQRCQVHKNIAVTLECSYGNSWALERCVPGPFKLGAVVGELQLRLAQGSCENNMLISMGHK
jgi:hypothetical protein